MIFVIHVFSCSVKLQNKKHESSDIKTNPPEKHRTISTLMKERPQCKREEDPLYNIEIQGEMFTKGS